MIRICVIMLAVALSMPVHNITPLLNPNHKELFQTTDFEVLVYGGAGGGKTYSIADKLLLMGAYSPHKLKAGCVRKTIPSLKKTVISVLEGRAEEFKIPFAYNKQEMTAQIGNLELLFLSCNNKESIDRIKGLTNVSFFWLNEMTELLETDYDLILSRIRGGKAQFQQVLGDFNPTGTHSWVYKRFFARKSECKKLWYNVEQNHPDYLATAGAKAYIERMRATKDLNYNFYKVYFLGEWGELEGLIYNWDVVSRSQMPNSFDEIFYGGDFGFSVDPTALVRIYRKADHFWVEELLYEKELTNDDIATKVKRMSGVRPGDPIYWDSAEPKSIKELQDKKLYVKPAIKGPDSVRAGIDFLKTKHIHILDESTNIVDEHASYVWKTDKDGRAIGEPLGMFDHTMDAIRYGIYTHVGHRKVSGATWL